MTNLPQNISILAVDDEEYNLLIIEEFLQNDGYQISTAKDGEEAWAMLEADPYKFDVVLLDRMMPKMEGLEVLSRIKAHETLQYVPTILQTASAKNEQIIEGIAAGAYYYITKPYKEDMFRAVVKAAVADRVRFRKLADDIEQYPSTLRLMDRGQFHFSTISECYALASLLSCAFPSPTNVVTGLTEIMLNALEFGHAELSYDQKTKLINEQRLYEHVSELLVLPENRDKSAKVLLTRTDSEVIVSIEDQGKGFDWKKYIDFSVDRATDNHGRGIATANLVSFDKLEYLKNGSKAVAKVFLH